MSAGASRHWLWLTLATLVAGACGSGGSSPDADSSGTVDAAVDMARADSAVLDAVEARSEVGASPDLTPDLQIDAPGDSAESDARDASSGPGAPVWYWGSSWLTENRTVAFVGYDQGCAQLGELISAADGVLFRVGYRLTAPVATRLKHYSDPGPDPADDGPLDGYQVRGTVLLVVGLQETRLGASGDLQTTILTEAQRVVAVSPVSASEVSIAGKLSVPAGNPCRAGDPDCRALLAPTFVVVWQNAAGGRAYQFIRPQVVPEGHLDRPRFGDCPTRPAGGPGEGNVHQSLGVYWPLREDLAMVLGGAPDPMHWTAWIDEVLPR
jgi:hypothetical protein